MSTEIKSQRPAKVVFRDTRGGRVLAVTACGEFAPIEGTQSLLLNFGAVDAGDASYVEVEAEDGALLMAGEITSDSL